MKIFSVFNILLKTEDSPLLEVDWLSDDLAQHVSIVQNLALRVGKENAGLLQNLSLNLIRLEIDSELPLLDFLGVSDHLVNLGDALDAIIWSLEKTLADVGHDLLVLADLGRNTNEDTKLGWEIDALLLLLDLKERLVGDSDFLVVVLEEVVKHLHLGLRATLFALLEEVGGRSKIPSDPVNFVSSLQPVVCHDDRTVEVAIDCGFVLKSGIAIINNC